MWSSISRAGLYRGLADVDDTDTTAMCGIRCNAAKLFCTHGRLASISVIHVSISKCVWLGTRLFGVVIIEEKQTKRMFKRSPDSVAGEIL